MRIIFYISFFAAFFFSSPAYGSGFDCQSLSLPENQEHIIKNQCETLRSVYAYEEAACALDVNIQNTFTYSGISSLNYHLSYQCPDDILKTEKTYIFNWLEDGRSIPVKAVWFSLSDKDRAGILSDVKNDQDPDGRCNTPLQPSQISISEDVIIFSGFYPHLDNPIQNKACDVSVLRPPSFLEAYLEVDGLKVCRLPDDLAIRVSKILTLGPEFLDDTRDKQLAAQIWAVFPKNYRELVFMAGSWWYPGWEPLFQQQPFSWGNLKESEAHSLDACQGPLFALGAGELLEIWHNLYAHIDPEIWITSNLRMQSGLWQADAINAFADFYPPNLQELWNEKAETKAWLNLSEQEIAGLMAWVNSAPESQCDVNSDAECKNTFVMPFIPLETLPFTPEEKKAFEQKIEKAKQQFQ